MTEENTPPAVVNLSSTLALDTADLYLVFPGTSKRTGWIITCAGPGHPQTVELNDEIARESAHRSAAIERAQVNGKKWKGDEDVDPEQDRRKQISRLVRRIVTWTPVDFGDGPIEFSHKAAVELFLDRRKGAYFSQLVDFLTAETAFMKGSAKD